MYVAARSSATRRVTPCPRGRFSCFYFIFSSRPVTLSCSQLHIQQLNLNLELRGKMIRHPEASASSEGRLSAFTTSLCYCDSPSPGEQSAALGGAHAPDPADLGDFLETKPGSLYKLWSALLWTTGTRFPAPFGPFSGAP